MEESSSELSDVLRKYVYQPLEQLDHIRLLRLHMVEDQIECTLVQVPLTEAKFEALSYVWGSEEKPFRAIIHDTRGRDLGFIPLTNNLYNALRDLRDTPDLKSKSFWIDQICINQDGEEKNHQVKIMRKIYETAARVIVYVGPAQSTEQERRGVQLLYEVDRHFAANYKFILEKGNIWNALVGPRDFPVVNLPDDVVRNYSANDWKWLANLASGSWYDRLWMVQVLQTLHLSQIDANSSSCRPGAASQCQYRHVTGPAPAALESSCCNHRSLWRTPFTAAVLAIFTEAYCLGAYSL
jgi:hypothetical protein